MPEAELEIVRITVGGEVSAGDLDELALSLDEAGLDAVIEPAPSRMGLSGIDLVELAIEIPLETLGALVLTVTGRRVWEALAAVVRRLLGREPRGRERRSSEQDVVVTIHDVQARVRLDLTLRDLGDDRLREELARLGQAAAEGPVTLRWNGAAEGWRSDASG
jgi:hypothetical protein